MNYTIIAKKVLREVIGIITIVLFIYTCTKIRSAAGSKRDAAGDRVSTSTAVGVSWPVQAKGYYPLLPRHGLPQPSGSKKATGSTGRNTTARHAATGTYSPYMGAGDQVSRVSKQ